MKLVVCVSAILILHPAVLMAQSAGQSPKPAAPCAPFASCDEYMRVVGSPGQGGGATTSRQPPDAGRGQLPPFDVRSGSDIQNAIGQHRVQGLRF